MRTVEDIKTLFLCQKILVLMDLPERRDTKSPSPKWEVIVRLKGLSVFGWWAVMRFRKC